MLSLVSILPLLLAVIPAYFLIEAIYNVFFHPLRAFPGPLLSKSNYFYWAYQSWFGDSVEYVRNAHEKYGDVVRVAPDQLSYINPEAWSDIAGHRTASGGGNLPKDGQHKQEPNGIRSIINANEEDHRRMRRLQNHAFSDKALATQEQLITGYIDKLIARLNEKARSPDTSSVDLVKWFNYTTFDILGDLAFGDSFGGLDSDVLHPWISSTFRSIKARTYTRIARAFPSPIFEFLFYLIPKDVKSARSYDFEFAASKARERMAQGATDRVDFMSYILRHNDEKGMTPKEIESNASLLILAGSEPVATFLSGMTYHLLKNPTVLKKLTELVRTTFPSEKDITILSVRQLEYFTACLEEGFRTYPPAPSGLPRLTLQEGSIICDRFVPPNTKVYVSQEAAYKSTRNFAFPERFVPERWIKNPPAEYASDNKKVLQPFSVGPKNCIGKNMAYAEIRLILARMLWNFDMELRPESLGWTSQKVWILWDKPPLYVKLSPRKL